MPWKPEQRNSKAATHTASLSSTLSKRVSWLNSLECVAPLERAQPRAWKGLWLGLQSSVPTGRWTVQRGKHLTLQMFVALFFANL